MPSKYHLLTGPLQWSWSSWLWWCQQPSLCPDTMSPTFSIPSSSDPALCTISTLWPMVILTRSQSIIRWLIKLINASNYFPVIHWYSTFILFIFLLINTEKICMKLTNCCVIVDTLGHLLWRNFQELQPRLPLTTPDTQSPAKPNKPAKKQVNSPITWITSPIGKLSVLLQTLVSHEAADSGSYSWRKF